MLYEIVVVFKVIFYKTKLPAPIATAFSGTFALHRVKFLCANIFIVKFLLVRRMHIQLSDANAFFLLSAAF